METFFCFKSFLSEERVSICSWNEASPDWKGAEGVKKLPCFWDLYFYGLFLLCNKLQLFYGAAVRRRNPEKPESFGYNVAP